VIAGSSLVDLAGLADVGAVYVWEGSATLAGSVSPFATLETQIAVASNGLGNASGQGLHFADVTGDGVLDIITGSPNAAVGGVLNAGAIDAWGGGAGLTGLKVPLATMSVPGASASDLLGS
jgi:hypothetical protein